MAVFRPRRGVELGAELEPYRPPDRLTPPAVFSDRAFIGAKSLDLRGRQDLPDGRQRRATQADRPVQGAVVRDGARYRDHREFMWSPSCAPL
jgi:hypothetical protein